MKPRIEFSIVVIVLFVLLAMDISLIMQSTWAQTASISPATTATNRIQTRVDPLPSWNDGVTKQGIIEFINNVTNPENTNYYIAPEDRIVPISDTVLCRIYTESCC